MSSKSAFVQYIETVLVDNEVYMTFLSTSWFMAILQNNRHRKVCPLRVHFTFPIRKGFERETEFCYVDKLIRLSQTLRPHKFVGSYLLASACFNDIYV